MNTTVYAHQGDTVDLLCWRHYGRTRDVTEAVLSANPGLADIGPVLPHGMAVIMPDISTAPLADNTIHLWD